MKARYKKKSGQFQKIARERIEILFEQADLKFKEDSNLSDRYVELARKISMKYKVRIPKELKRRFCKHCYKFLVPGVNCRVRNNDSKIVYSCFNCKKFMRFPLSKDSK